MRRLTGQGATIGHPVRVMVLLLLMLAATVAAAEEPGIALNRADVSVDGGGIYFDAHYEVALSREADQALRSGVPLVLATATRVVRPRWWWWDAEIQGNEVRKELRYHALSRRYVVVDQRSGDKRTFFRRAAALDAWSSIDRHRVIDRASMSSDGGYLLEARARLDLDALPYPLRTVAQVSPDWRLTSDWQSWPLDG